MQHGNSLHGPCATHSLREKPRLRFFMAASDPAIVSRIFSPAAAALDRAAAVLPPNLHSSHSRVSAGLASSRML